MPINYENGAPTKLQGKYSAMVVCWLLGNGCLFSWNSMLTIEDYYVTLFPLGVHVFAMDLLATSSYLTTTNAASSCHPDGGDKRKLLGVKHLLDTTPNMKKLPPEYVLKLPPTKPILDCDAAIPVINLSGLDGPVDCRMRTVRAISDACADWGFFRIKNHGIKFSLMEEMVNAVDGFFNLPWEEKMKYASDDVMNPIRYGTSLNTSKQHDLHWRDYLRHFGIPFRKSIGFWPINPPTYRGVAKEYLEEQWKLSLQIAGAISEGLGLERNYIEKTLGEGYQIMASNYYPPCPEPDRTLGLAPHSDHGGIIVLMENGVPGLHVKHKDQWVAVQHVPGTFVVNIGDYIEILSNGRYKSVEHRAVVNAERTRISIATSLGPELTSIIQPAAQLLDEKSKLKYKPIAYKDYVRFQQTKTERAGKSPLQALLVAHNSIESFIKCD